MKLGFRKLHFCTRLTTFEKWLINAIKMEMGISDTIFSLQPPRSASRAVLFDVIKAQNLSFLLYSGKFLISLEKWRKTSQSASGAQAKARSRGDLQRRDPADFEGIRKAVGSMDSDSLSSSRERKWTPSTAVDETTVRTSNLCRRCPTHPARIPQRAARASRAGSRLILLIRLAAGE